MSNRAKIVKNWTTKAGLPALIVLGTLGTHCGYVGVSKQHKAYGKDYSDDLLDGVQAHGGLTYAGKPPLIKDSEFWAIGYDCGHLGDFVPAIQKMFPDYFTSDIWRDEAFCVEECEDLAHQLAALDLPLALPAPNTTF